MVGAMALLFVGLLLGPGVANAQTSCSDYLYDTNLYVACVGGPSLTVTPGTIPPGGTITVDLAGWHPGSNVTITIGCNGSPVALGSIAIGPDTKGSGNFTVPADCPLGPQVVTGTGPDMLDNVTSREGPVVIAANATTTTTVSGGGGGGGSGSGGSGSGSSGSGGSGSLPSTGSNTGRLVTIGAALVVIGASALYGSARSRRSAKVE